MEILWWTQLLPKTAKDDVRAGFCFLQGNPGGNNLMTQAIVVKYRLINLA